MSDTRVGTSDEDGGWVTAFVVMFATTLLLVAGLVLDGGRMLAEHRRAGNLADSAARAGAQAIDDQLVRDGAPEVLDTSLAEDLACGFVDDPDYSCDAVAVGNSVEVTLTGTIDLLLLPGASPTVEAAGSACVAVGITDGTC